MEMDLAGNRVIVDVDPWFLIFFHLTKEERHNRKKHNDPQEYEKHFEGVLAEGDGKRSHFPPSMYRKHPSDTNSTVPLQLKW